MSYQRTHATSAQAAMLEVLASAFLKSWRGLQHPVWGTTSSEQFRATPRLAPISWRQRRIWRTTSLPCSRRYCGAALEYGCGGSTVLAASHSNLQVFGVESDPEWLLKVEAHPAISRASAAGRVLLEHVNIGPTKKWGKPINEAYRHNWPRYSSMPWSRHSDYNLIFVDGRFRVACILHAVLKAPRDATIVVHDFWNRPQYHVVLPFLDWKQSCRTLGVFQKRSKIDQDAVETLIEKYQYISA